MLGIWYFLTLRWGKAFGFEGQAPLKKVVVNISLDPLQGREKRVKKLVRKYFKLPERDRALMSVKTRDSLFFDTAEHARRFIKELSKIIHLDKNKNAPTRLVEERLWDSSESWYWDLSDVYYCRSCKRNWVGRHRADEHSCPDPDVHSLSDIPKKELKRVVETIQKAA